MRVAGRTDQGKVRELNEDAFGYRDGLFVVADGMGGHQAGEVASAIAVETILQADLSGDIKKALQTALETANKAILNQANRSEDFNGMGTTAAVLYLEKERAFITHVGDSRVYYLSGSVLKQLTSDHSLVNELVKTGEITVEEARTHPQRNILTRALGSHETLDAEILEIEVAPGDKFLLCSDGLSGTVPETVIKEYLIREDDPEVIVDQLINYANELGGADNITVILVEV
ncbi:MAG: Stp1/IreP family PP2C-type Ser/Thr phosphatase [Firmicutes bacterium]|nr:Stp1/IreP family PP2C-type Ser/Thr phosphatase [Bacillota bacterium]